MDGFIIVMATDIADEEGVCKVKHILSSFKSISQWTIDMDDWQKVVRMVASTDIATPVLYAMKNVGVKAELMGIFNVTEMNNR